MINVSGQFDELADLVHLRCKHLPGRHDQSKHDPHKGVAAASGTPVTMEWLDAPDQAHMFVDYYPPEQRRLKQALIDGNVMREDLDNFKKFSITPPEGFGYKYDHEGVLRKKGLPINGVYLDGEIHISKLVLYGDKFKLSRTMSHEVGHHVVRNMGWRGVTREGQAERVIHLANLRSYNSHQLANAGLRPYSLFDGGEFVADTYLTMRNGDARQKLLLLNIWGEVGVRNDLSNVFKALGMVYANELRAIRNEDGTIDLVQAPIVVNRHTYEKTPWYYVDAK